MTTILCMKWGRRYPSDYVNRLRNMILRHVNKPARFIVFTDDPTGLAQGVEAHPIPPINLPERVSMTPWRKMTLWRRDLLGLSGDALFLDLDIVIVGGIDPFFEHRPGCYAVIHNWTQPKETIGNTSVFRFKVGAHSYLFDRLNDNPDAVLSRHRIEQQYISAEIKEQVFWPDPWCVSFKHGCLPAWPANFVKEPKAPEGARIVVFSGKPDPDEAMIGRWPAPIHKKLYKFTRPARFVREHWR